MKAIEEIKKFIEEIQNTVRFSAAWNQEEAIKFNEGIDYAAQKILNYIDGEPNENK